MKRDEVKMATPHYRAGLLMGSRNRRLRFLAYHLPRALRRDLASSWGTISHNVRAVWIQSDPQWLEKLQADWAELEDEEEAL